MEYRSDRPIEDPVLIDFAPGLFPGMEILSGLFHPFDHNIVRKKTIQRSLNRTKIHLTSGLEMGHLPKGMRSCIRSSRSDQTDTLACEKFQFFFDHSLDGKSLGLHLPTQVIRSIVFYQKLNVSHLSSQNLIVY